MTELAGAATPGTTLAAARAASGLSVDEVARQMRISPRQVAAIEADRYQELPGTVFVRGFVRNYARLLNVDPVPLMHALDAQLDGGDVPLRAHEIAGRMPEPARGGGSRLGWIVVAAVVALTAAAAAYEWWQGDDGPTVATAEAPAPAGSSGSEGSAPNPPATAAAPQVLADASSPTLADTPPSAEPAQPRGEPEPATSAAAPRSARLDVEFARESWVEVRDAGGQLLYSGTGSAGSVRSFELPGAAEVVVGNVAGVRITYNGQPFDLSPHANRNIARFTLP